MGKLTAGGFQPVDVSCFGGQVEQKVFLQAPDGDGREELPEAIKVGDRGDQLAPAA